MAGQIHRLQNEILFEGTRKQAKALAPRGLGQFSRSARQRQPTENIPARVVAVVLGITGHHTFGHRLSALLDSFFL